MSASLEQDRKTDSPTHAAPSLNAVDASPEVHDRSKARAPIDYSSVGAFFASVLARFRSIWTRRFVTAFLCGQLVALCITCTNVATNTLVGSGWQLPTLQTVPLYFALFIAYTPYTIYKYGFRGWGEMTLRDGWRYFILAACDVEANFLVVKAYQYSDLLSCMLLNAWATPVCMFFTWLLLRTKFHWSQLLGVGVCIGGLALLVVSDLMTHKNWDPVSRAKGNGFMIAGATLYGFSNATEEFFVRKRPFFEVLGQLGMFGFIICGVQAAALEHDAIPLANWSARNIGLYMAYIIAMIVLYTVAPLIYRMASSTFYNLSLLGSSFYGLLFGLFLFHYRPYWLYFVAFIVVIVGLIIYFWHSTPEEQAVLNPQTPEYVKARREQAIVEETVV